MGLDMHAFTTKIKPNGDVDFKQPREIANLCYWRKRWDLHGWMEKLYSSKGGQNPDFNLAAVVLIVPDVEAGRPFWTRSSRRPSEMGRIQLY